GAGSSWHPRQGDSAQPAVRPRAGLARWQRPFPLAGDIAGPFPDRAHRWRRAGSGYLAADLPPGVRCPGTRKDGAGDGGGKLITFQPAPENGVSCHDASGTIVVARIGERVVEENWRRGLESNRTPG